MSVPPQTLTRRWPSRRAALLAGGLSPTLAHAWLEGATAVLARADAAWTPASVILDLQIRSGEAGRSHARWSIGSAAQLPRPSPDMKLALFVLNTLYSQGISALAGGLLVDPERRRMALVNGRPTQVIGRAHGETTDRPALWIDHQRQFPLQVATPTDELRLLDWDWTAATPTPTRLEHHRGDTWLWVAAVAVAA